MKAKTHHPSIHTLEAKKKRIFGPVVLMIILEAVSLITVGCESVGEFIRDFNYNPERNEKQLRSSARQGNQSYYENWKKIYLDRGLSEKEAIARASDKHYFKYHQLPRTGSDEEK